MVLLLFPMANRQTGPAIKRAFENLGHKVYAVDAKLEPRNSYAMSLQIAPDLVFCSRTRALAEQVVQIKERFPNAKTCMWNVDTRNSIDEWRHLFPLIRACDYYFVVAYNTISQWKEINENTCWLPQGLQNETYKKPMEITDVDRERYACDVSFAGTRTDYHRHRVPYLEAIVRMGVNFKQWGCLGVPRVYNEEHNKMVALSKINLACSGWPQNGRCVSVRDYKIMGAGGFLLERQGLGMDKLFPSDILDYYTDIPTLVERIRYWLSHDEKRQEVAERGYKWVHANATYTDRICKALNYMGMQS